jgi:hypothetical protein
MIARIAPWDGKIEATREVEAEKEYHVRITFDCCVVASNPEEAKNKTRKMVSENKLESSVGIEEKS